MTVHSAYSLFILLPSLLFKRSKLHAKARERVRALALQFVYARLKQTSLLVYNYCASTVCTLCKYCIGIHEQGIHSLNPIDTCAHTLVFNFCTITNHQAIDALVFAVSIDLFVHNRIESTQPRYNCLEFTNSAHCMLAQLALSNDSRFSVSVA